jgi:hypothetical protein
MITSIELKVQTKLNNGGYMVEIYNEIDNQFTNCLFGCNVLSVSKRIMNEVMCLAEDLDCKYILSRYRFYAYCC